MPFESSEVWRSEKREESVGVAIESENERKVREKEGVRSKF